MLEVFSTTPISQQFFLQKIVGFVPEASYDHELMEAWIVYGILASENAFV